MFNRSKRMERREIRKNLLLHLLGIAILLSGITACSSSKDEDRPLVPDAKVEESDWQTVPTGGGTIEKGDITIKFPNGTFAEEAKIAVTKVDSTNLAGEYACSECYQIVLPATGTAKEITISFKCDESTENVDMLAKMPGWNSHTSQFSNYTFFLDSKASGKTISTTIPIMNSDGEEQPFFTIGLANSGTSVADTRAGNSAKYDYKWDINIRRKYYQSGYDKSMENILDNRIPRAFDELQKLKFEFPNEAIKFVFRDLGETWGNWVSTKWSKVGYIELNAKRVLDLAQNTSKDLMGDLDQTIIHETTHGLQAMVYDPRWFQTKRNIQETFGDEWAMASEAIGSWVEKMVGNHHLGANSTSKEGKDNVKSFMTEFTPHYWSGNTYLHHGYGMALLIEYLASKSSNEQIVELYQYQKQGLSWKEALKEFMSAHNIKFFDNDNYYAFAMKVLNGELEDLVNYTTICNYVRYNNKVTFKDTLFNYGIRVNAVDIGSSTLKLYDKSTIRITQEMEGTKNKVYYDDKNGKLVLLGEVTKETPFEISVNDYVRKLGYEDVVYLGDGQKSIYIVSTREKNYEYNNTFTNRLSYMFTITDETASRSEITFDLIDKNEEENNTEEEDEKIWNIAGLHVIYSADTYYHRIEKSNSGKVEEKEYDYSIEEGFEMYDFEEGATVDCTTKKIGENGIHVNFKWSKNVKNGNEIEERNATVSFDLSDYIGWDSKYGHSYGGITNLTLSYDRTYDSPWNRSEFHTSLSAVGIDYYSDTEGFWYGTDNWENTPNFQISSLDFSGISDSKDNGKHVEVTQKSRTQRGHVKIWISR